MSTRKQRIKHRWRAYETPSGSRPVRQFLDGLPRAEAATILAGMKDVASEGLAVARHLKGEIYEVRASTEAQSYRLLFAPEGKKGRVLLALAAFPKKTQKTPGRLVELADRRLADWRRRGHPAGRR